MFRVIIIMIKCYVSIYFHANTNICILPSALWTELLRAEGLELGPSLDLNSLAKITEGFTPGHILMAVRSVLCAHRLKKLLFQPLTAAEFIQSLSRVDPVYREEEEAFKVRGHNVKLCL